MINKYLHIVIAFLFIGSIFAQTTETFETEIDNSKSFTDNSQVFNITSQAGGTFDIANFPGTGWNGIVADNKFIDNSATADIGVPIQFTIKSAGGTSFHLKSVYLFLSQSDLNPGNGSCTIIGKKSGLTVFTATSNTGFNSNMLVNNGYTLIDLASYGGANNSNTIIDEYVVTTTGSFEYVALDAMKWEYDCSELVAPTANAQIFCNSGTVANLVATGNSLKWYAGASGGSPLAGTTALTTKTYYVTSSSTGCESARIPVSVTITPSSDNVTVVSACDSYTWNGTTYTTSGIKTGTTTNCVTEKLDLTITPSSDNVTTVSACDSYTWNGTTYTTSGIKTGTTTNCVTEKLDLTITPSSDNVTVVSACESYTWNGMTYTTSGIKTGTTTNCVTEKLDLTITPSSDNVTTVSACDSYTWNGTTYTTSGIKTGLTTNCVTQKLDLTITPSSDNVTVVSACDSYTWNGTTYTTSGIKTGPTTNCVTQKLDLTITPSSDNVTVVSACDSYTWNGTTYTTSGIKTGPTANCVTEKLNLTITASPITTVSLISPPGESTKLSADQIGASYQWIDCNNANTPIFGEINQSFTPSAVGTYSVIITLGTCSVTSNCIVVSSLKVNGFDIDSFNFYPNPVKDNLYLSYSKEITSVKVFNLIGQALLDKSINDTTAHIEMSSLPSGTYFVEVKSLDSYKTIKVIKK